MHNAFVSFFLSDQFNGPVLLDNLKHGTALHVMAENVHRVGLLRVLLNELAPSAWMTPTQTLTWAVFRTELFGWCSHAMIASILARVSRVGLRLMTLVAFALEIHFVFAVNATFINPLNAALDIATYGLGSMLSWRLIQSKSNDRTIWQNFLWFMLLFVFFVADRRIVQMSWWHDLMGISRFVSAVVVLICGYGVSRLWRKDQLTTWLCLFGFFSGFAYNEIHGIMKSSNFPDWTPENAWFMLILAATVWLNSNLQNIFQKRSK